MFLHEFREDFVLALELFLQEGDPPVLGVTGASGSGFEGGGVLEELLLPAVEHGGVDVVLVTKVRNGGAFGRWSRRMAAFSWALGRFRVFLGMGEPPLEIVAYSSGPFFPFRLKQNTRCSRLRCLHLRLTERSPRCVSVHFFFVSRKRGDSARVKTTTSSPVTVLISWCRLTTLVPVTS